MENSDRDDNNSGNHQSLPADGEIGTWSPRRLERKNSMEVTQKLIDLSTLVPGQNEEMDEATVISKTIEYMKELHETVSLLEDRVSMEQPFPANKKAKVVGNGMATGDDEEDDAASEDTASSHRRAKVSGHNDEADTSDYGHLPDIQVRFMNNDVFVRIHCRKSKGLLVDVLNHLENLHLSPMHNSGHHFGSSHLDITIVAQMEEGFAMTVQELITSLRMALSPFS